MVEFGPRPKTGRYMSKRGERCWITIGREPTELEDGSVSIHFDDGSFTSCFFRTFAKWHYQRLPEDQQ